jgi:membrane protease YdiL (CAAX protease family)
MRPLPALSIYIGAVFLGGALVAPWLYWLTQSVAQSFPHLANSPFHRFVNRSLLGLALIGLWPLFRGLGIRSWKEFGLTNPTPNGKRLVAGFSVGFSSLAIVAFAALGTGARMLVDDQAHLIRKLLGAALTAIVVAVLEEILFRGALFGTLRRVMHWGLALIVSSIIYALVHFMESARVTGPVLWYSGFEVLPRMLRGLVQWQLLIPGLLNLTLAGVLLALAYQRTGNLYFSIGLHAGWIFWLKSYGIFTREVSGANAWIWGGAKLIDGWVASLVLAPTLIVILRLPREPNSRTTKHILKTRA